MVGRGDEADRLHHEAEQLRERAAFYDLEGRCQTKCTGQ